MTPEERISRLEEHLVRQIDENRKISTRLDEVLAVCIKEDNKLENDIIKLEKALDNYREYKTSIEDLETDVMYLKENIKCYHELVLGACPFDIEKTIRQNMKDKCPICEGKGIVFLMNSITDIQQVKCKSCEGKGRGIV